MRINRRDFFKGSAFVGSSFLARNGFSRVDSEAFEYRFPVLQGATSFTKTQINIMSAENIVISVPGGNVTVSIVEKPYSVWKAYRVLVDDLSPGTKYELQISSPEGVVQSTRFFSTLTPGKTDVKVALVSCMRDKQFTHQAAMWDSLVKSRPDIMFLLGDNVYVDDEVNVIEESVSEERFWRRYVETRLTLDLYHMPELVPTLATWDDHDFGLNNSYGSTSYREAATHVFKTLFAQDAVMPEVTWGPGIATAFSAYGQRFYLMDNRSFRTHPYIGKAHWGIGQEEWMYKHLATSKNPGWIFSGSQIFGGYRTGWGFEENHPKVLKRVLSRLSKIEAPVLFGSGDVHYSEIMNVEKELLGYESIEITSSSMHSNAKEPRSGNKRRISSTGEFNFVIAHLKTGEKNLQMNLRSYGSESRQFFEVDNIKVGR